MAIRLGDEAPNFTAETTDGTLTFHDWKDGILGGAVQPPGRLHARVHHRAGRTASLKGEFESRGVKAIAISVDPIEDHRGWAGDIGAVGGVDLNFPIIADPDRTVSNLYDMIHPGEGDTSTVRSVFIVDPKNKVRLTLTYPKSVGRNFDEILRVIDALQLTDRAAVSTPVDWTPGDRVIVSPTAVDGRRDRALRRRRGGHALPPLDAAAGRLSTGYGEGRGAHRTPRPSVVYRVSVYRARRRRRLGCPAGRAVRGACATGGATGAGVTCAACSPRSFATSTLPGTTRVNVGLMPAWRVSAVTSRDWSAVAIVTTMPAAPARAVRPERCR